MRFLVWLLGLSFYLFAIRAESSARGSWTWVWVALLVVWCFGGVVLAMLAAARWIPRARMTAPRGATAPQPATPGKVEDLG